MKEEVKYLENVKNVINYNIDSLTKHIETNKKEIINTKRYLYESSHEIYDTDLTSMMNEEDFNVSLVNTQIDKVSKLKHAYLNPYFGRVDFNDEKIYIGLTDVSKDNENLVFDWRSDIASLYYDEKIGKSTFKVGDKTIEGNITKRRNYTIKMGKLISFFDSDIAIRDELLQEVLNQNASENMKNIVTTIQKEQNEIIRYGGNIIVEGASGSGKTSIAMHKASYTLYKNSLNKNNILIFTPSKNFIKYISGVLPSLGEENVKMTTFNSFANEYLDSKAESLNHYFEHSKKSDKLKLSKEFKEKIDKYLKTYKKSLKFTKKLGYKKLIILPDELNHYLEKDLSVANVLEYASSKLCDRLNIDEDKNVPQLTIMLKELLDIKNHPLDLYNDFLESINLEKIDYFSYPDVWAALYLYFNIHGYPSYSNIKEVIIDEAQDYSIFEFILIKKIFNSSKFTVLGDSNQNINPLNKYSSLKELSSIFDAKYIYINKSYRSSKRIVEFSNKILNLKNIVPIRTYDSKVIVKDMDKEKLYTLVNSFKEDGFKVAVITKTKEEALKLKKLKLNASILPVNLAKGLEFDAVIVYTDKDNYYTKEEFNLYYVAATRALHKLAVVNQKYTNFVE